jgi:hypothetical protein
MDKITEGLSILEDINIYFTYDFLKIFQLTEHAVA